MSRRVYLHIGAPKTGTTALQTRLHRNSATLLEHGVLVPRSAQGPKRSGLALRAALELTGLQLGQDPASLTGSWDDLVAQTHAHDGTVVVSHEAFVRCDEAAVATVVESLGAGAELHVIYTARDLGKQLVSGWLEGLKNGGADALATHFARARSGELPLRAAFDLPVVLGRWLAHLPSRQVHLVTVPPPGGDRALLWRRFAGVVGLDDSWVPKDPPRTNESVGVPEAQLLLALNRELGGTNRRGGPDHKLVRRTVVARTLVGRDSPRVEVPRGDRSWLAADVESWIDWLDTSGIDVVGDVAELRAAEAPDDALPTWTDVAEPHPGVAAAAAAALAAVIAEVPRPDAG